MRTTIDVAGRVIIPKQLRDQAGLRPGPVEISSDGTGVHIEPLATDALVRRDGRLVIPASGAAVTDDDVRAVRDADQRS